MKQLNFKYILVVVCYLLSIQIVRAQSRGTWEKDTLMKQFPCITDVENKWNSLDDLVRIHFDTNCDEAPPLTPENLLTDYKDLLALGEHDSLVLTKAHDSEARRLRGGSDYDGVYQYQQYYKGYPVDKGGISLNLYQGKVKRLVDAIRKVDMEINPLLTVEEAEKLVAIELQEYLPHRFVTNSFDGCDTMSWTCMWYGIKEVFLQEIKRNKQYKLKYKFLAWGIAPPERYYVWVNPLTAKISIHRGGSLHESPCLIACNDIGDTPVDDCSVGSDNIYTEADVSSCSFFQDVTIFPTYGNDISGTTSCQSMIMDYCLSATPNIYRLSRTELPTIDVHYGTFPPTVYDEHIYFPNEDDLPLVDQPYQFKEDILTATSTYWGLDMAVDYFSSFPNYLNSFDDDYAPLKVVINSQYASNAEWMLEDLEFSDIVFPTKNQLHIADIPNELEYCKLQTISHEYTHGVLLNAYRIDDFGTRLLDGLETYALHEGLSDVFAILTDRYLAESGTISSWGWNFKNKRFLNNPNSSIVTLSESNYYQADTYKGTYWNTHLTNPTWGMQYIASGVPCYWFYLLSEGGSDTNDKGDTYTVTGIGVDKAERILVEGLKKLATTVDDANRAAKFGHLRDYTITAAGDLYGDCSVEVIETMNAWYAVGVGTNEPELWMKDGESDIGLEPNKYRFVYDEETGDIIDEDIWASPDLWNRLEVDIDNFNIIEKVHQQPAQDEIGSINNTLLVEVHNTATCSSPSANVHLYWTIASTGETWDGDVEANNDWINATYTVGDNTCLVGDEIGTITILNDDIPLGETRKYGLEWTPPSQTGLESCDVSYDENNPGKFEICFLARILSTDDPLMGEQNGDNSTKTNVINFNNIVTRNTFILPVTGGGFPPIDYPVRYIFIKNTDDFYNHLDISIEGIVTANSPDDCLEDVSIDIVLTDQLWEKWESTGLKGDGVTVIAPKIVRITDCSQAKLKDIPFESEEKQILGVKATLSSGKRNSFSAPINYRLKITHEASDSDVTIKPPTACLFDLKFSEVVSEDMANEQFTISTYPNPFTHHIVLDYELAEVSIVSIRFYDIQGRQVATITDATYQESGKQTVYFNGNNLAKGIYLCAIQVNDEIFTQKVVKMD